MAERSVTDQTTGEIVVVSAFDREVDGTEGSSFTFTASTSLYLEAVCVLIPAGGGTPLENTATNAGSTTISVGKPGTPSVGDTLLVVVGAYDNAGMTWSAPAGWSSTVTEYDTHASLASTDSTPDLPDVTTAGSSGRLIGVQIGYNFGPSSTPSGWTSLINWDGSNQVWHRAVSSSGSQGGPWGYTLGGSSTAVTSVFAYTSGGGGSSTVLRSVLGRFTPFSTTYAGRL